jgi:hypothetical protein
MTERKSTTTERLRRIGTTSRKALGAVAVAGIVFAPIAAEEAIEHTSIQAQIVDFPAELSLRPQVSQLNMLNQANFYIPVSKLDIGIKADVEGLPRFQSADDIGEYISPRQLAIYSSLAQSPSDALDGYETALGDELRQNFLLIETPGALVGGLALLGTSGYLRQRRRIQELEGREPQAPLLKRTAAGVAVGALIASSASAYMLHQEWRGDFPPTKHLVTIDALDKTSLHGTSIDNPALYTTIENGISYAKLLRERRTEQRIEYEARAIAELKTQIDNLPAPQKHETVILSVSDIHASLAGIKLIRTFVLEYQKVHGEDALRLEINLGDVSQGLTVQKSAVIAQAKGIPGVKFVVAPGNHDLIPTRKFMKQAKMIVPDGYKTVNGIDIYSRPDPLQTPFLGDSYYPHPTFTEEDLGKRAYEDLLKQRADLVDLHEPDAVAALLGIKAMRAYAKQPTSLTTCSADKIADIPAALVSAGHWHEQYPLKLVCNSDGTWTTINIQGTAGGANGASTVNNWSDPDGAPVKTLSFRMFYFNTKYRSVTGAVDINVNTDGHVLPMKRTNIGTPTGAPFSQK